MKSSIKQNGFSLTELIVVIAIITVMVAILLPALAAVHRMALNIQCKSNMRQVGVFYDKFMQDYDGYMVPNWWNPSTSSSHGNQKKNYFIDRLGMDLTCYTWGYCLYKAGYVNDKTMTIFRCPTDRHYKTMSKYFTKTYGSQHWRAPIRPNQLKWHNYEKYTYGDMRLYSRDTGNIYLLADSVRYFGRSNIQQYYYIQNQGNSGKWGVRTRHNGSANLLFLDGSVRSAKGKELHSKKYELNWGTSKNRYIQVYPNP